MIFTSYFGNLKNLPTTVIPIAISNTVPDGIHISSIHELAPTWSMVTRYKGSGDRDEFRHRYLAWLDRIDLGELTTKIPSGDVVFLCYEKDPATCHRSILAEWFKDRLNIEVREWGVKT